MCLCSYVSFSRKEVAYISKFGTYVFVRPTLKVYVYSVQERAFFTLSRTLYTLIRHFFYFYLFFKFHIDQKYLLKQFEIFP